MRDAPTLASSARVGISFSAHFVILRSEATMNPLSAASGTKQIPRAKGWRRGMTTWQDFQEKWR